MKRSLKFFKKGAQGRLASQAEAPDDANLARASVRWENALRNKLPFGRVARALHAGARGTCQGGQRPDHGTVFLVQSMLQFVRANGTCDQVPEVKILFQEGRDATLFKADLQVFCDFTGPIAKGITCLEASDLSPSDVFCAVLSVQATLAETLTEHDNHLDPEECRHIRQSANARWTQQVNPAADDQLKNKSDDIFQSAFLLDPRMLSLGWRDRG
jgi:hypothetical protein